MSKAMKPAAGSAWARPSGTPPEIIADLHTQVNAALADPAFKAQLANLFGSIRL